MVDAQPVENALAQQLDDLLVRGVEHLPVLHAHPDQVRNGEETPIVELGAGQAPPAEPVPLRVEQLGKGQRLRALAQRERVLVVAQHTPVHLQTVQLVAQPVAEHGQQDPPALRLPVDVEPVRVGGVRSVPQYLLEGPVEPGRRRHVVGHDVGDQAEPVLPRSPRERPQPGLTTQLVPHARVVHDVVPVRGTGYGLQDRRQMQVRDTQRGQIRDGSGGRGEQEQPAGAASGTWPWAGRGPRPLDGPVSCASCEPTYPPRRLSCHRRMRMSPAPSIASNDGTGSGGNVGDIPRGARGDRGAAPGALVLRAAAGGGDPVRQRPADHQDERFPRDRRDRGLRARARTGGHGARRRASSPTGAGSGASSCAARC